MSAFFLQTVKDTFEEHRNSNNAFQMSAYMKNRFPFLGIQSPMRRELSKSLIKILNTDSIAEVEIIVIQLWDLPEREYQYFALQLLESVKDKLTPSHIEFVMDLVVTKSWWDTIDWLAPKIVGTILGNYPDLIDEYIPIWVKSNNIWLNRTAIIYQLKYKKDTDFDLLKQVIDDLKCKKEFFVKKAIGWSLREYSKTQPEIVEQYIQNANLQALSEKEGMKYILKSKS